MLIVRSQNGVPIRLTEERWQHIVHRHPEMDDQRERVLETVAEPDMIQKVILVKCLPFVSILRLYEPASFW